MSVTGAAPSSQFVSYPAWSLRNYPVGEDTHEMISLPKKFVIPPTEKYAAEGELDCSAFPLRIHTVEEVRPSTAWKQRLGGTGMKNR